MWCRGFNGSVGVPRHAASLPAWPRTASPALCGLASLAAVIAAAYRLWRWWFGRVKTERLGRSDIRIKFLGLWDTVDAYGVPIPELKRGIDWVLWPMLFGDFKLSPKVDRACHAFSLDDERTTFHPLLWDEVADAEMLNRGEVRPGRITQVWFAGVHSNVGGGYPEDRSLVPLEWIMREAKANGLPLDDARVQGIALEASPYARLYDSRAGLAAFYRYGPRRMPTYLDQPNIRHGMMIYDANQLVDGCHDAAVREIFSREDVAFINAHTAKAGCMLCHIERA